jgi:hypothetical protein
MRQLTWLLASCAFLAPLATSTAIAQTAPGHTLQAQAAASDSPFPRTNPTGESFFLDAKALIQDQINLASRLETAMGGPDPNAVRAVDGQIVIHSGKIDRFMALHYPVIKPRCGQLEAIANSSTASQDAVTCDLLANSKAFSGLQSKLFARLNMLSGIAPVEPLPLVSGENSIANGGIPTFQKGSLQAPAPTRLGSVPDLPRSSDPLLGRPMKSAIGNYEPPIPPAITAPPEVTQALVEIQARLESAKQNLSRQAALPQQIAATNLESGLQIGSASESAPNQPRTPRTRAVGFTNPANLVARADANAYDVYPGERVQYQEFLQEPHTGITRVLTRQQRDRDMNQLQNRLEPTVGERYPYAILVEPSDPPLPDLTVALRDRLAPVDTQRFPFVPLSQTSFAPRLAMQLEGDAIQLQNQGLDYGFMVDMGKLDGIELNEISAGLEADEVNLRPDMREFFLSYRVPNKLEQLMLDRRRFLSAKAGPSNLPTLLSPQAPMEVGHTYLLRTVQFDAPEALTQGKPITPEQRRNLDKTLAMPGKDLLVVFQPVAERHNGSYTVLWRVLGEFPVPDMTDAANYATFEQSTIVRR